MFRSSPDIRRAAALCGALLLANALLGQNPARPAATFSTGTELVTVPVIVTAQDGSHIDNLKEEDFTLLEDGKEQPIATYEEVHRTTDPPPAISSVTDQFSNMPIAGSTSQPLTIVVLDLVNTLPADQVYARAEVIRYMTASATVNQAFTLLTLNRTGVNLIHHFSSDRKELVEALSTINRSQPPVLEDPSSALLTNAKDRLSTILQDFGSNQVDSEQAALSLERRAIITLTLQSMQQIAQAFTGASRAGKR
jgi:VWFA-related protein